MCSIDLEPCDAWAEQWRKAAKPHRCNGCQARIVVGHRYVYHFSVFDGDPSSEHMCALCWLTRWFFGEAHGQLFNPGMLEQMLMNCIDEGDDESVTTWQPALDMLQARRPRSVGEVAP